MIIRHAAKTLPLLALVTLTTACSTQDISLPGGQLLGQQQEESTKQASSTVAKKVDQIPDINTDASAPMRKTVLKAPPVVASTTTSNEGTSSAFGVVASEAKPPVPATAQAAMTTPAPVTTATVSTIPKPTSANVVTTSQAAQVSQSTTRRLTLNGSATFKTGSSSLSNDGKQKLSSLARSLSSPDTKVIRLLIEGHTDSTGSAAANQVLSLKRANAVADYLASEGLVRSSMETLGLGESSPIADNTTKAGRAQNRRVEITATGSRQTTR